MSGASNYPEGLSHLAAIIIDSAVEQGCEQELADAIGVGSIERFRKDWGGSQFYVPKLLGVEIAAMHAAIYEAWRLGTPPELVARRFGKSLQHIYFILREQKRTAQKQKGLFDDLAP
jgi:Mor family transcriptional regulator